MTGRERVLVTGVGGPAGHGLAEQLVRRGVEVVGVDLRPVVLPGAMTALVPGAHDPEFVRVLLATAVEADVGLVIPTVSEELVAPGLRADRARPAILLGSQYAVTTAADKWLTYRRLNAIGVPVPRSALPSQLWGTPLPATGDLGRPVLSKPRRSRGARGVVVHDRAPADVAAGLDDDTILQEFVPGPEYAVNLFLAADPDRDVVVALEKTRLAHGRVGNALAVRPVVAVEVCRVARRAARAIGLSGPADIDVRLRADGTPVVLEINARFGAHSAHAPEVLDALLTQRQESASGAEQ